MDLAKVLKLKLNKVSLSLCLVALVRLCPLSSLGRPEKEFAAFFGEKKLRLFLLHKSYGRTIPDSGYSYIFIVLSGDTPLTHICDMWSDGQMAILAIYGYMAIYGYIWPYMVIWPLYRVQQIVVSGGFPEKNLKNEDQ